MRIMTLNVYKLFTILQVPVYNLFTNKSNLYNTEAQRDTKHTDAQMQSHLLVEDVTTNIDCLPNSGKNAFLPIFSALYTLVLASSYPVP